MIFRDEFDGDALTITLQGYDMLALTVFAPAMPRCKPLQDRLYTVLT